MEKRLLLAVALSLLVLLSWSTWISKAYHIDNKEVTVEPPILKSPVLSRVHLAPPEQEVLPSSLWKISQEKFEVTFIESQAAIKEVAFKDYHSSKLRLGQGFLFDEAGLIFTKENSSSAREAKFVYQDKDKRITKRFIFSNSNYTIELEIKIQNLSQAPLELNPSLVLGTLSFSGEQNEVRFQDVTVANKDKISHLNARKDNLFAEVQFLGLRNRYFCAILEPVSPVYSGWIRKINPQESQVGLQAKAQVLAAGQEMEQKFRIYLGPQDLKIINRIKPEWSVVMYYGTFNLISHLLLQALEFLYQLVHNWGGAILLLSLGIYLLLYPLTLKQMRSMKEMQILQPRTEELRQLYKDNPQKLNKEIMGLYRQHKINPLGGCLPLLLQMPIFLALYQALMRYVALKGAKFLWIKDLSEPDRLFVLPVSIPILGNEINILPIAMAIGMFLQQKLSLSSAASGSAEQQKLMLVLFPLMFGFIFYRMPAALVLYWLINSTLMLAYQFRLKGKHEPKI